MECPNCEHINIGKAKFCNNCGYKLLGICAQCGTQNPEAAKFCNECGNRLEKAATANAPKLSIKEQATVEKNTKKAAERRQLTVLFCDLVGSTALSNRLDVEEYRQVILGYQQVAEKVITSHGGHIAQYLGDGLLVYFGYPKGLEDAPKAAVQAGLGILEVVNHANIDWEEKGKTVINIRIGIHTGLVVVDDFLALGDTVNIAARLESLAPENGLVISAQTYNLVQGWFTTKSLGAQSVKGIPEPIEVFQVLQGSDVRSRIEIRRIRGLTPLVGREEEVHTLTRTWNRAKSGIGQLLLLYGEAGIGKSRLVESIKTQLKQEGAVAHLEMHGSELHVNSTFYPIVDLFERKILSIQKEDTAGEKRNKLEMWMDLYGFSQDPYFQIFANFLSIPIKETQSPLYPPSSLSPVIRKNKFIEGFTTAIVSYSNGQPLLLILEDLHWMDASTMEWLEQIILELQAHPIFILCTTRPQFQPSWLSKSNIGELRLFQLELPAIEAICLHQTQGKSLPKEVLAEIKKKTDGIPLFIEELTRTILESGALIEKAHQFELIKTLADLSIPSSLQDSLNTRLDNLSMGKEVAQMGAILGREFSFDWIKALTREEDAAIEKQLDELVNAELLYKRGSNPNATFIFKHALIQDAAYASMLKSTRRRLHVRVLEVIEKDFPDLASSQPEMLAHHMSQADLHEQSILKWEEAGKIAQQRFANFDAVHHFKQAISKLAYIENVQIREVKELDLLLPFNSVIMLTEGWMHPKVKENAERILELCESNRNSQKTLIGYFGLGAFAHVQGDAHAALRIYQKGLEIAKELSEDGFTAYFYTLLADIYFHIGNFKVTLSAAEQALQIFDPNLHQDILFIGGGDITIYASNKKSNVLLILGFPVRAQIIMDEIAEQAHSHSDLISLWRWMWNNSINHLTLREYQISRNTSKAFLPRLESSGEWALLNLMKAVYYVSVAILEGGKFIEQAHSFLDQLIENGMSVEQTLLRTFLLEAYLKEEDYIRGMNNVHRIKEIMEQTGEIIVESELYRCEGALRLLKDEQQEAEKAFIKAIEIAQSQSAKWFELLGAKSLARLWQSQGKIGEAYDVLHDVYSWFTEGFDTLDMVEAKELLEELAALNKMD